MKNIALVLSYDGTNYNDWQIQKNGPSIQESMETALFRLLGEKVHVSGVGRTDSGVHARRYVASFKTERCTISDRPASLCAQQLSAARYRGLRCSRSPGGL